MLFFSGSVKKQQHPFDRLRKVTDNAARLVYRSSTFNHVTPLLYTQHWLPIKKRIDFKLASICFKSLNGSAPTYLSDLLHLYTPSRQLEFQNTLLSHKVKWSALFLLPSSNNMEQASRFYPSRILCQFLQIFPKNLSLFEFFFSVPLP